jgi:hypothetical protein
MMDAPRASSSEYLLSTTELETEIRLRFVFPDARVFSVIFVLKVPADAAPERIGSGRRDGDRSRVTIRREFLSDA